MLHNIWIAKDTGECLYHKKYGSIDHDENLITSFLSAIEIFAQNVDNGCDFLQTKNYKFIVIWLNYIILASSHLFSKESLNTLIKPRFLV